MISFGRNRLLVILSLEKELEVHAIKDTCKKTRKVGCDGPEGGLSKSVSSIKITPAYTKVSDNYAES